MQIEFVFIAEAGELERQALLLAESVRAWGGRYAEVPIVILQPRRERPVSAAGRERLRALGARLVELEIVSPCPEYGTSYRVLACAEYERRAQAEQLILLDSDLVLLAEPELELGDAEVGVRPVDVPGMCTSGAGDPKDAYWRALCAVCGVDYEALPWVHTTVDRVKVKACYNGGLLVVRRAAGLCQKTADFFHRGLEAGLIPWPERPPFAAGHGLVGVAGGQRWGSAQAALALAIVALQLRVRVLPASLNFPLHSYPELRGRVEAGEFPPLALVHYHHVFRERPYDHPIVAGAPGFPPGAAAWLQARATSCWHTGAERLVLVLGMHRSGTSLLTKALGALGVDLGTDFHPATADNPTGFWEDRHFHGLNEELMATLGHAWDAFSLLEPERVAALGESAFFPRALALVRQSFARHAWRALKDPRFSVLLPFWKRVFAAAEIRVSYVIAFRHPLSVAQSLAARDAFPAAKALWLWIVYNVQAIRETAASQPLVVDYDALMDDPAGQLDRLAHLLALPLDAVALAEFVGEFVDPQLRHARFGADDLGAQAGCDPLVCAVYATLCGQAQATELAGAEAWAGLLAQAGRALGEMPHLLRLASEATGENEHLRRQLAEQGYRLESLRGAGDALAARDGQIASLAAELAAAREAEETLKAAQAEREAQADHARVAQQKEADAREALARTLAARDEEVAGLRAVRDELEAEVAGWEAKASKLEAEAAGLEAKAAGLEAEVVGLEAKAAGLEAKAAGLKAEVAGLEAKAAGLEAELALVKTSRSWRCAAAARAWWQRLPFSR